MNICHHIIRDDLTAGIGPLMSKTSSSLEIHSVYNCRQLWFWLHLKAQSVKIESDWFDIGNGTTDAEKAERANYKAWTSLYDEARAHVTNLLERKRMQHEDNC